MSLYKSLIHIRSFIKNPYLFCFFFIYSPLIFSLYFCVLVGNRAVDPLGVSHAMGRWGWLLFASPWPGMGWLRWELSAMVVPSRLQSAKGWAWLSICRPHSLYVLLQTRAASVQAVLGEWHRRCHVIWHRLSTLCGVAAANEHGS